MKPRGPTRKRKVKELDGFKVGDLVQIYAADNDQFTRGALYYIAELRKEDVKWGKKFNKDGNERYRARCRLFPALYPPKMQEPICDTIKNGMSVILDLDHCRKVGLLELLEFQLKLERVIQKLHEQEAAYGEETE